MPVIKAGTGHSHRMYSLTGRVLALGMLGTITPNELGTPDDERVKETS